jgi:hypothetical protein
VSSSKLGLVNMLTAASAAGGEAKMSTVKVNPKNNNLLFISILLLKII